MGICLNRNEVSHGNFIQGNKTERPYCFIGVVQVNEDFGTGILIKSDVVLTSKRILSSKQPNDVYFYPAKQGLNNPFSFSKAIGFYFNDNEGLDDFALILLEKEISFDTLNSKISKKKNYKFLSLYCADDNELRDYPIIIFSYPKLDPEIINLYEQNVNIKEINREKLLYNHKYNEGINGSPALMTIDEKIYIIGFDNSSKTNNSIKRLSSEDIKNIKSYIKQKSQYISNIRISSITTNDNILSKSILNFSYKHSKESASNKNEDISSNDYIFRIVDDLNIDRPFCYIGLVKTKFHSVTGILIKDNIVLTTANILYDKSSYRYTQCSVIKFIPGKNRDNCPYETINVRGYYFPLKYKFTDDITNNWGILLLENNVGKIINERFKKTKYYSLIEYECESPNENSFTFYNYYTNEGNEDILVEGKGPIDIDDKEKRYVKFFVSKYAKIDSIGGIIFQEKNAKKYIVGLQYQTKENNFANGFIFNYEAINEIETAINSLMERYDIPPNLRKTQASTKNNFNISVGDSKIKFDQINIKKLKIITNHNNQILGLIYLPNYLNQNDIVATFSIMEIKLWKISNSNIIKEYSFTNIEIYCLLFIQENTENFILTYGASDNNITLLDLTQEKTSIILSGHKDHVTCIIQLKNIAYQEKDHLILSGSKDMTLKIWDYKSQENLYTMEGHSWYVYCLVFLSEYGNFREYFASGSGDYIVMIWKFGEITPIQALQGHKNIVNSLIYPENCEEKDIIVSSSFQEIRVWKISTGECINCIIGHDDKIANLVYLSDFYESRDIFASASSDCTIKLWRLYQSDCIKRNDTGNSNPVIAFIYLDSKVLGKNVVCCVTKDGNIKVFDIEILA